MARLAVCCSFWAASRSRISRLAVPISKLCSGVSTSPLPGNTHESRLVLAGVEALLAFVLPKFGSQFSQQWLQLEFARNIMQAMLGTEIVDRIGPHMFQSMAWVHPVPLALAWAHALLCCTRVPAGEVDRGTADVLLGLPVSRWEVFFSETFVWLVSGMVILAAALLGNVIGSLGLPHEQRPEMSRLLIVLINFFCLYAAVGSFAWLISAFSDRRGRAMTFVFLV